MDSVLTGISNQIDAIVTLWLEYNPDGSQDDEFEQLIITLGLDYHNLEDLTCVTAAFKISEYIKLLAYNTGWDPKELFRKLQTK